MCYDIKTRLRLQLKRARRGWDEKTMIEIEEEYKRQGLFDYHHVSGFQHPKLITYTNQDPNIPVVAYWGLVPLWVRDEKQQGQLWNQTLNARGETIFEKPAFRDSAKSKRCLIYIDAFYEHHHYKGKTYPYFIHRKDFEPLILAGLWSSWNNKATAKKMITFSIVTTKANPLMAKIHNNPKLPEPRMPVIFEEDYANEWLLPKVNSDSDKLFIESLIQPYPQDRLEAHTVGKLRGKNAVGNITGAADKVDYPELESQNENPNQGKLF